MRTALLTAAILSSLAGLLDPAGIASAAATAPHPSPPPPSPGPVTSASPDPMAAQLQRAATDRARLDATKAALAGAVQTARDQQQQLTSLLTANRRAMDDTVARMRDAERRLQEATDRQSSEHATAAAARTREAADRRLLAEAVRLRYMQPDDALLGTITGGPLPDALGRMAAAEQIAQRSEDLLAQVRRDESEAMAAESSARADATTAAGTAGQLVQQKAQLQQQTAAAGALVARLGDEERAATAQIATTDAQTAALAERTADLRIEQLDSTIAAAQEQAWKEATLYLTGHLDTLPGGLHGGTNGVAGGLLWAAPGAALSQPFGPSSHPFEPAYAGFPHFHTGIDLAAPMDTPVLAAADGIVVSVTESTVGYGNHVVIGHSPTMLSLYGHLATMIVHPGDAVRRGQLIGLMGSTGNSTGPHLHFEVRVGNVPTDPAPLLAPAPPAT